MHRFRKPTPTWPPPKKMPVSYFGELCTKKNVEPTYDYLDVGGQDPDGLFNYKVCVEDLTGVGRAKNKKLAKHYAVQDLLHKIVDCGRQKEWFGTNCAHFGGDVHKFLNLILFDLDSMPGGLNEINAQRSLPNDDGDDEHSANKKLPSDEKDDVERSAAINDDSSPMIVNDTINNPINTLAELCCHRNWPESVYCDTQESGMPHQRKFTVRLHLGKFCVEESGRSKKLAKKQAAEAMLKLLYESPLEQRDKDLVVVEDPVIEKVSEIVKEKEETNGEKSATKIDEIENRVQSSNGNQEEKADYRCDTIPEEEEVDENGQFSDPKSREQEAEILSILKSTEWHTVEIPNEEHKNLMNRISKIFGFKTSFLHLPRKAESDLRQCLLEIEDAGMTCFGYGSTEEGAEFRAALNALDLYKRNIS